MLLTVNNNYDTFSFKTDIVIPIALHCDRKVRYKPKILCQRSDEKARKDRSFSETNG